MIIGLTGTIGSGKGELSTYLRNKNFNYITISDLIREELLKRNLPLKREELQNLGNEMRKIHGNNFWAKKAIEKINLNENLIIDGIRNIGEVEEFKNLPNFFLLAIDAPEELRLIRTKRRKRVIDGRISSDPQNQEKFKQLEKRDRGFNEPEYGQQVLKCLEVADYTIINDSTLDKLYEKLDLFLKKFMG